jgi:RNA polymerase sigma factor (sigma-70 family)
MNADDPKTGSGTDAADFERVYADHLGRVKAYLRRCGFARADVDDLAQEVFVRAYQSLHTFDPSRGPIGPWLGAIAHNVARRQWGRRPQADLFDPSLAAEVFAAPENAGPTPEAQDALAALRGCLDALPPDLARIVRLRYVDGRTTRGVAEAAHMAEATVRLRLDEAKTLLARCLKGKGVWE